NSEKSSGQVRVGCGSYIWEFQPQPSGLARRLTITIEAMQVLPAGDFERVFGWLATMDYPWSSPAAALQAMPRIKSLSPVAEYLARSGAVA
ncbi:MAG: hypothetical protein ABIS68_03705, partial [Casimicrobiaceae bacterium]